MGAENIGKGDTVRFTAEKIAALTASGNIEGYPSVEGVVSEVTRDTLVVMFKHGNWEATRSIAVGDAVKVNR